MMNDDLFLHRLHGICIRQTGETLTFEVYFHYPAAASPLRPADVQAAQGRRPQSPAFNTLTDGLEDLSEEPFEAHLN